MKINGKTAIVTGAARGIGAAIAHKLGKKGATGIAVVDLSDECHQIADTINSNQNKKIAVGFCGDVNDAKFRQEVFSSMENQYGPVRICVPAAGIIRDGLCIKPHAESGEVIIYAESDFRKILDINLIHPTYWAMETIASIAKYRINRGREKWQVCLLYTSPSPRDA